MRVLYNIVSTARVIIKWGIAGFMLGILCASTCFLLLGLDIQSASAIIAGFGLYGALFTLAFRFGLHRLKPRGMTGYSAYVAAGVLSAIIASAPFLGVTIYIAILRPISAGVYLSNESSREIIRDITLRFFGYVASGALASTFVWWKVIK